MQVMQSYLSTSPSAPPSIVQGVPVSAVQTSDTAITVFSVPQPGLPTSWRVYAVGAYAAVPDGARHVETLAFTPDMLPPGVMPVIMHVFAEPM